MITNTRRTNLPPTTVPANPPRNTFPVMCTANFYFFLLLLTCVVVGRNKTVQIEFFQISRAAIKTEK